MLGKTNGVVYSRTDLLLFQNQETFCGFLMTEILQNQERRKILNKDGSYEGGREEDYSQQLFAGRFQIVL